MNTLESFLVTGNWNAVVNPSLSSTASTLTVEPVSATVTLQPRLPKGFTYWVEDYLVQSAYSGVQTAFLLGQPDSGTWKLQHGGVWTTPLAWNITPAQLQVAIEALPSIGAGNVRVAASITPQAYDCYFQGALLDTEVDAMVADGTALRNSQGYKAGASVTRTTTGGPEIVADTAIALAAITGRIVNGQLCSIDRADSPGVALTANSAVLQGDTWTDLYYDVSFTDVKFNGASQFLAPFSFIAPTDSTPVCLTSPALVRHLYKPAVDVWWPGMTWNAALSAPAQGAANVVSLDARRDDWRARAS